MSNSGRQMTNISFRKAIAALIDKIKENVTPTVVTEDVDDFEALNSDVFDAGMAELVEAVPAGGGGGGGGSSSTEIIEATYDESNARFTTVKTLGEIKAAMQAKKMVIIIGGFIMSEGGETLDIKVQMIPTTCIFTSEGNSIALMGIDGGSQKMASYTGVAATDNDYLVISGTPDHIYVAADD